MLVADIFHLFISLYPIPINIEIENKRRTLISVDPVLAKNRNHGFFPQTKGDF